MHRPRTQRAIAVLFLALILIGVVVGLVRSFHTAAAVPAPPPATVPR